jgi:hypothetical protein
MNRKNAKPAPNLTNVTRVAKRVSHARARVGAHTPKKERNR